MLIQNLSWRIYFMKDVNAEIMWQKNVFQEKNKIVRLIIRQPAKWSMVKNVTLNLGNTVKRVIINNVVMKRKKNVTPPISKNVGPLITMNKYVKRNHKNHADMSMYPNAKMYHMSIVLTRKNGNVIECLKQSAKKYHRRNARYFPTFPVLFNKCKVVKN